MTTFVPTNQKIGEFDTKQALYVLQIGAGPGVPAGILHGARFVKRGCFKYMVHNNEENKDYCIKDYFLPRGIGIKYSNP